MDVVGLLLLIYIDCILFVTWYFVVSILNSKMYKMYFVCLLIFHLKFGQVIFKK